MRHFVFTTYHSSIRPKEEGQSHRPFALPSSNRLTATHRPLCIVPKTRANKQQPAWLTTLAQYVPFFPQSATPPHTSTSTANSTPTMRHPHLRMAPRRCCRFPSRGDGELWQAKSRRGAPPTRTNHSPEQRQAGQPRPPFPPRCCLSPAT